MKMFWYPSFFLTAVLMLNACGLKIHKGVKDSDVEQSSMRSKLPVNYRQKKDSPVFVEIFQKGKRHMERRRFAAAEASFRSYVEKNFDGEFIGRAKIYLGQIHLMNRKASLAEKSLREAALLSPPSPYRGTAQHYLSRSLHAQGKNKEAADVMAQVRLDEFYFQGEEKDFFAYWGRIAEVNGKHLDASMAYLKAISYTKDVQEIASFKQKTEHLIQNSLGAGDLDYLLKKYDDPQYPAALLRLKQAERLLMRGDKFGAQTQLGIIYQNYPSGSQYVKAAKRLEARSAFSSGTKSAAFTSGKLGALLSFSGRSAAYGRNIREGLELSLNAPNGLSSGLQVVYRDPGKTPHSALAATEELIRNEGVMAILGPVNGDQAEEAAKIASEYGVPFISLSPRGGLSEKSPFVFEFSLNPENQIKALVDYAYDELAARRFAILFPEDNFGKSYASSFFETVAQKGAFVTAAESYKPSQVDFKPHIENMVGTALRHFRKGEWETLRQEAERRKGQKLSSKEIRDLKLDPIVDFDVLFLPDTYRALGQIAPSLAYADVKAVLMGPATWNNVNTLRRAGPYLEGAYFVDVFSRLDKQQGTYRFINLYRGRYNKVPGPLSALGFDLGGVLSQAYRSPALVRDRKELLSRLSSLGSYTGVLGVHFWNADRNVLSELKIFKIKKSSFNYVKSLRVD